MIKGSRGLIYSPSPSSVWITQLQPASGAIGSDHERKGETTIRAILRSLKCSGSAVGSIKRALLAAVMLHPEEVESRDIEGKEDHDRIN